MLKFILRRLIQAVITIVGVMALTFLLFNVIAGDVSASFLGPHARTQDRLGFKAENHLDLPVLCNVHSRLRIEDCTTNKTLQLIAPAGSDVLNGLELYWMIERQPTGEKAADGSPILSANKYYHSRWVAWLGEETDLADVVAEDKSLVEAIPASKAKPKTPNKPILEFRLVQKDLTKAEVAKLLVGAVVIESVATARRAELKAEGKLDTPAAKAELEKLDGAVALAKRKANPSMASAVMSIDLSSCKTTGDLIQLINTHPANGGRFVASIPSRTWGNVIGETQFFWHLRQSLTMTGKSWDSKKELSTLIAERGPYSLALTIPGLALGWFSAMIISCFVAYYRGKLVDKLGVFLSVLGMCVPLLAYMIAGQYFIFQVRPDMAFGLKHTYNIYIPILIGMVAGLGGGVRFYRTVILNEVNQDYVRTARAKGLPLPSILFKHVLKNCMLPILTNLVMILPFLIMGNLLLEKFFGIPGLGGLMIDSITKRDLPIINTLTFLTAAVYTFGLLLTDILYAVFDPRIRLK